MLVFTWNLHRNEPALRLAIAHLRKLAQVEDVLAVLQEVPPATRKGKPWHISALLDKVTLAGHGLTRLNPIVASGRVVIITSSSVRASVSRIDGNKRMLYAELRAGTGARFAVIGLHAIDRYNYEREFVRGSHAALARREIDELWNRTMPLMVVGDFNAEPTEPEVRDREGLFSVARLADVTPAQRRHYERPSPPLLNLTAELQSATTGTHYYNGRWWTLDQLAVSEGLANAVVHPPRIIDNIGGESLVTRSGRPDATNYSDHLPVEVGLQI